MNLFYTPLHAKTGDVIPFFDERTNRFENFYLKNWNPDAPRDEIIHGWHRITTEDNRTYTETPVHIHGGTGSVIYVDGLYHLFYCTFDFNPSVQWVRHATSEDLTCWKDIPEDTFQADGKLYRLSDWRDPYVFWNEAEGQWWMLLAARENISVERNGCVALCVSDDLKHWRIELPLYAPRANQGAYECPDLFQIGEWYYLVYSNYTDGFSTCYRMSRSPRGPWLRPAVDTFDGRAFYAAKTGFDGKKRYIYGWNPTRGENVWDFDPGKNFGKDYQTWNWGGSIVVHQIHQRPDGTLGVGPVNSVSDAFTAASPVTAQALTGSWEISPAQAFGCSENGYAAAIGDKIPVQCCIRLQCSYHGNAAGFGLALQVDETFSQGYYLMFEPQYQRIQFRSGLRMYEQGGQMFPYAVEMERPLRLEEGRVYDLELYIQDTIGVLYVDRDVAFGFRMYNHRGRNLGFYVSDGNMTINNAAIWTEN
ncbi:MAG: family 43 glycosylhydrolase [Oscillospiraceae bacterium]|nr:family 43 glycosylhydrolase [Oscillospiraceae bacterium]